MLLGISSKFVVSHSFSRLDFQDRVIPAQNKMMVRSDTISSKGDISPILDFSFGDRCSNKFVLAGSPAFGSLKHRLRFKLVVNIGFRTKIKRLR